MTQGSRSELGAAPQVPQKVTGVAHLLAAARYSVAGFHRLKEETAARHEIGLGLLALVVLGVLGVGWGQISLFAVLLLLLIAVEALNTAIEVLTNRISPEWSLDAKHAKDLGSLAVALVVLANLVCFAVLLVTQLYALSGGT